MKQIINVSLGAAEYTQPVTITESNGANISGDSVQISLGSYNAPGAWVNGVLTRPSISSATIKMLVDNSVSPGVYYVWVKVTDTPEIAPRRALRVEVV